ncbi:hypothetical protein TARUN_7738 [Trichoderma arundinaceum]|uniref:Uncharacterized protein n=1 Tax=Trichoderma arundinaceum TaxID=490622 RepID=A0A395NER4_TRIAR|nr:hypothetical protein TARUN_7738 [Trichoderma arundinaceum]
MILEDAGDNEEVLRLEFTRLRGLFSTLSSSCTAEEGALIKYVIITELEETIKDVNNNWPALNHANATNVAVPMRGCQETSSLECLQLGNDKVFAETFVNNDVQNKWDTALPDLQLSDGGPGFDSVDNALLYGTAPPLELSDIELDPTVNLVRISPVQPLDLGLVIDNFTDLDDLYAYTSNKLEASGTEYLATDYTAQEIPVSPFLPTVLPREASQGLPLVTDAMDVREDTDSEPGLTTDYSCAVSEIITTAAAAMRPETDTQLNVSAQSPCRLPSSTPLAAEMTAQVIEKTYSPKVIKRLDIRVDLTMHNFFATELPSSSADKVDLLARLFFAIASPSALLQLCDAFDLARKAQYPFSRDNSTHLGALMEALDSLDASSFAARILRRYYLVSLLKFRLEREKHHKTASQKQQKRPKRLLKYDLQRLNLLERTGTAIISLDSESNNNQKRGAKGKRADSQAIQDLVAIVHPEYNASKKSTIYQKTAAKLKSRLACARNWYQFSDTFSPGILALIPSGGEYRISIDQVEKLSASEISTFLAALEMNRGSFIKAASLSLGNRVANILNRQDTRTKFNFENVDASEVMSLVPDSPELLQMFSQIP